jgi:putative transposase
MPETEQMEPEAYSMLTFFTCRTRKVFITDSVNRALCGALNFHIKRRHVDIAGFVIMPDHVHLIARPLAMSCAEFVTDFKTYTGTKIKENTEFPRKVWRRRFYELPIKNLREFESLIENIHLNPVREKIAPSPDEYPWSSHANYQGLPGVVQITVISRRYNIRGEHP